MSERPSQTTSMQEGGARRMTLREQRKTGRGARARAPPKTSPQKTRCAKKPRAGFGLVLPLPAVTRSSARSARARRGRGGRAYDDGRLRRRACERRDRRCVLWRSRRSAPRRSSVGRSRRRQKRRGVKRGGETHRPLLHFSNPGQPTASTKEESPLPTVSREARA